MRPSRLLPLALLPLVAGCRRRGGAAIEEPIQRLEGLRLAQSTLGSPGWDLTAKSAELQESDKVAQLAEPSLRFYEKKKEVSTVDAHEGVVRMDTYDVTLTSDVVVRSLHDHSTLTTQELHYSSKLKRFVTDAEVEVRRPDGVLRGKGLEATPDLSDIAIFNQRTVLQGGAPE